jgi:predicted ArsR family transcriptional regulator
MGDAPESPLHWTWAAVLTDPARLAVLRGLCELEAASAAELAARCHTSNRTARRHLEALEALGAVREEAGERDGLTPGRPPARFRLDVEAGERLCAVFELLRKPLVPAAE